MTPQAVTNLKLAQRGDLLEIAYVAPRATSGGARLGVLDIEILRADAPGDFQKMARRTRRRAAPGESLAETSPLPSPGTTVRVAARALDRGHISALSSVATIVVQPPPPAPHDLSAELKGEAVALRWMGTVPSPSPSPSPSPGPAPSASPGTLSSPAPGASPGPRVSPSPTASPRPSPSPSATPKPPARGFLLYRRSDPGGSYGGPIRSEPFTANAFEDKAVSLGQRWCYVVGTVVSTEPVAESTRSNEACVSVHDIVAPAAPSGVAALGGPDGVEVSWSPSTETDLASYRVYREAPGGPRERVGEVAPPETSLRDATAAPGTRYTYSVTAVDRAGNESPPSAPVPGGRP
ncbi:MAG TPA: fibronectin type III domain-containing protein [Vicinamibacteria bacterium]|nr:fibronectin type III domain-containing protein [Vicinamibacteria bacterium]